VTFNQCVRLQTDRPIDPPVERDNLLYSLQQADYCSLVAYSGLEGQVRSGGYQVSEGGVPPAAEQTGTNPADPPPLHSERAEKTPVANAADMPPETSSDRTRKVQVVRHATPRQHVIVWLVGVLLASLIPLLFTYFHGVDRNRPPSIFNLLGHGDLLLISLVVTIAGITELALSVNKIRQSQLMSAAMVLLGSVLAIAAEGLWYADISAQILDGQKILSVHYITFGSLLLFMLSAFCSSVCVWLSAGTR